MLHAGAEVAGIDGATMSAEDGFLAKMINSSLDVRKMVAIIGAFYFIVMTALIIPGAVVASFLTVMLPALCVSVPLHNWVDHKLCRMVNNHWVSAMQVTGLNVVEYGDDISQISEKRVLCLANHLGLSDHSIIMSTLRDKGSIVEKYLWVIFNIWKVSPMGAMWAIHGNYFVNAGSSKRKEVMEDFKNHLARNFWKYDHRWIIMYPEGARLYKIRETNARYVARESLKLFKHCALPRIGAAHSTIVATVRDKSAGDSSDSLEYIVDCTIGYPNGNVPHLKSWMLGELSTRTSNVAVYYRIHRVKPEWRNEETLKKWLYQLYEEKDNLLDNFYKTGKFPRGTLKEPRVVQYSLGQCLLVELFWIFLFYAHYSLWIRTLTTALFRVSLRALTLLL